MEWLAPGKGSYHYGVIAVKLSDPSSAPSSDIDDRTNKPALLRTYYILDSLLVMTWQY